MSAIDRVHAAFERYGRPVDPRTGMACCPAHDDDSASLSIGVGDDGRVLFRCFAGCQTAEILAMVNLKWPDIFENDDSDRAGAVGTARRVLAPVRGVDLPATGTDGPVAERVKHPPVKQKKPNLTKIAPPDVWYHYWTANAKYVHSVMRWNARPPEYPKKEFRQGVCRVGDDGIPIESRSNLASYTLKGVERVMYRLPELAHDLAANPSDPPLVLWVEGEKDVDALRDAGWVATTSAQGADGFKDLVANDGLAPLRGADVIVWPDNDEKNNAGFKYGAHLVEYLTEAGANVVAVVVSGQGCKDAADHIAEGYGFDEPDIEYLARLGGDGETPSDWASRIEREALAAAEAKLLEGGAAAGKHLSVVAPISPPPTDAGLNGSGGDGDGGDGDGGDGDGGGGPIEPRTVLVNDRPVRLILNDLKDAVLENNKPPVVFQRDGQSTYLHYAEGRPRITQFRKPSMQHYLSGIVDAIKKNGKTTSPVTVPGELVEMILADPQPVWPMLELVTHMPLVTIKPSGMHLRTVQGYDEPTRSWYEPLVDIPDVPMEPSADDVADARDMIEQLLGGFAFEDNASKANAIAMLFSPLLRNAAGPFTPMFVIRAPQQGSGKSTLAALLTIIHTGESLSPTPFTDNDEEMTKNLTALLNAGDPIIVFDNMERTLRSAILAGILTSGSLRSRVLGKNDQDLKVNDRAVWVATGNNLKVDSDFARRTASIVLNPRESRPETRSFEINDITGWAERNRAELIWSMLVLVAHWAREGQKRASYGSEKWVNGQYRNWVDVIGGVIESAGFDDTGELLSNRGEVDSSNDEAMDKERMLLGFWDVWGKASESFSFSELIDALTDVHALHHKTLVEAMPHWLMDRVRARQSKSVQMYLSSIEGAMFGEHSMMLVLTRDNRRRVRYTVTCDPNNPPPGPDGVSRSVLAVDHEPF